MLLLTSIPILFLIANILILPHLALALPALYTNKCNDSKEYYTTTRIINYDILYSITTRDNKTHSTHTESVLYNNPTFEDYLDLATTDNNITLSGKVIFEYEILSPCYYTCAMEITGDEYTSKTLAKQIESSYQTGNTYPMMCNSYGCRSGTNYCETFKTHDEF